MTYVAGDRVVTDLLCKPFSMGKNLLCVHSKKHMDDDPSQKSAKMKQNLNTVKAMQRLLKKGGLLIWIAPAGGRDRRDADGQITPGNWDPAAVEMMRKLGTKKGMTKTHYYPLGELIFIFVRAIKLTSFFVDSHGHLRHHAPAGDDGEGTRRGTRRELYRRRALPRRGDRRGPGDG